MVILGRPGWDEWREAIKSVSCSSLFCMSCRSASTFLEYPEYINQLLPHKITKKLTQNRRCIIIGEINVVDCFQFNVVGWYNYMYLWLCSLHG